MKKIQEKTVKERVKKLLREHGCYWFMPVQSGYGSATLDFLGSHRGRFFAVETKAPGKRLSPRQELVKEEIEKAAGKVFVVGEAYYEEANTFSGMELLEAWILLER
jgi:hypothetical protein